MPQTGGKKHKGRKRGKKKSQAGRGSKDVAPFPNGAVHGPTIDTMRTMKQQTGGAINPAAVLSTVQAIKPFSKGKQLSKSVGLYDYLEKRPSTSWLNRIADFGEQLGGKEQSGGRMRKVTMTN